MYGKKKSDVLDWKKNYLSHGLPLDNEDNRDEIIFQHSNVEGLMRVRKCFRCSKDLDFENFIKNSSSKTKEHLTRLWNSDYIEFFCCHCYNIKMKYQPYIGFDEKLPKLV